MHDDPYNLPIINTIKLFPIVNKSLIELLKGLDNDDWKKETVLPGRTVKDLAAHICDASIRRLSMCRDDYHYDNPNITCYKDLVDYIQQMNNNGITFFKIVSSKILISLLQFSEPEVYKYFLTLQNEDTAKFPVAWAGEDKSKNWFDIARDYTEKWHHQMQIRLAVDKPGIDSKELFYPVIDTFMRGLPHAYQSLNAETGTNIAINITGNGGGTWFLEKASQQWRLSKELSADPLAKITMSDSVAWRVFTDSIDPSIAMKEAVVIGNKDLAAQVFKFKAIMR